MMYVLDLNHDGSKELEGNVVISHNKRCNGSGCN